MRTPPRDSGQQWQAYNEYTFTPFSALLDMLPKEMLTPTLHKKVTPFLNELVVMPATNAHCRSYPIFDFPNLYTSFVSIWDAQGRYNPPHLRRWLEAFGMPTVSMAGGIGKTKEILSPFRAKIADGNLTDDAENLKRRIDIEAQLSLVPNMSFIFTQTMEILARDLSYCMNLYKALRSRNDNQVIILAHGFGTEDNLRTWIQLCGENQYADISRETTYRTAWASFLKHLAGHVDRIAPRPIKIHPDNPFSAELKPEYRVPDLIAAMWLQFYTDITGDGVDYKTCKFCGKMFRATHKSQEFCQFNDVSGKPYCKRAWDRRQAEMKKRLVTSPLAPSN